MILAIDETLAAVSTGRQHHQGRQLADDNRGLYAHRRLSLTTFTRKNSPNTLTRTTRSSMTRGDISGRHYLGLRLSR
jgi:hypothetical protein